MFICVYLWLRLLECTISRSSGRTSTPSPSAWPLAAFSSISNSSAHSTPSAAPRLTEAEQLKAQKNAKSAEVGKLRKDGQDTAALQQEVREIGDHITALDEKAKAVDESFRELMAGVPNIPHESVPVGKSADDNVEVRRWGQPRQFDFAPKAHWDLGAGAEDSRSGARHQDHRRALRRLLGHRRAPGAGAHQLLSGRPHARARLYRSAAAVPDQFRQPVRHRPASQVQAGSVQDRKHRFLACAHRRSAGDQSLSRRDARTPTIFRSHSAPTRRVSAAKPGPMDATCAASSASISSRKWSW